ncbi:MAG: hypothetical protein ABFD83_01880 [Armatimonadota bacterium]
MKLIKTNTAVLVIACIGVVLVAGCGGGGGGTPAPDTSGPKIENMKADTSSLTFVGGNVTIMADVTDASSISSVKAAVSKGGKLISEKAMTLSSGSTYQAVVTAPSNISSASLTCTVVIYAVDANSLQSHEQFSFNVPVAGNIPPSDPF